MIRIESFNESFVRLDGELSYIRELSDAFTFRADGFNFHPSYKAGVWDGFIRLIHLGTKLAPKGLVPSIIKWAQNNNYRVSLDEGFVRFATPFNFDHTDYDLPFEPRDFQLSAVQRALDKKRQIILSATGSGKSFIIYMITRALESENILIVVPTVSLVNQLYNDFKDYSVKNGWDVDGLVHRICDGTPKDTKKRIVISTWQSIYKQPRAWFERFGCVIGDECHTFKATSLATIMNNCVNAFYRFGLSGTLEDSKVSQLALMGHFGPIFKASSTSDLMKAGVLTNLVIKGVLFKWLSTTAKGLPYKDEIELIVMNNKRNRFITKLSKKLSGNTLVLFQFVEKHGKPLYKMIKEACPEKKVYFVYGGTDSTQREAVRKITEENDNVIIIASYALFSTGVNIKNLHNIVTASPTKSKIRILQSIGRGLRKHESKDVCTLYDIADDLRCGTKKKNYTLKHFQERVELYIKEGFDITVTNINLDTV